MKDCTTCKYGYEDERLGIPMCHHPKRFSEDCIDFNMHEEKHTDDKSDKSLEEAAEEYIKKGKYLPEAWVVRPAFIAGWKCRDDQMPMPEDTVLFQKGVAEGRRLEREDMLKDAMEGQIYGSDGDHWIESEIYENLKGKEGDKVRIIVLKEEE